MTWLQTTPTPLPTVTPASHRRVRPPPAAEFALLPGLPVTQRLRRTPGRPLLPLAIAHHLFCRLIDADHLDAAAARTVQRKRSRPDVAWFLFDRERKLRQLREALADGSWRPERFRLLFLLDPKPRVIARASVPDRVVHTALALLLEPIVLRSASEADYACRDGHGQHRAVLRLLRGMREHPFVVHLDIKSYFPSIDLAILRAQLAERVHDDAFFAVLDRVLESGRGLYDSPGARRHARLGPDWPPRGIGLPMGAVTSQLLAAHLYLQRFDHWVKRVLKVQTYVRYVDDMFLFGSSSIQLEEWRVAVREYLGHQLHLRLKHEQAPVLSCRGHLDGLGMRIQRSCIEPMPRSWRRWRRRLADHVHGREPLDDAALRQSLASAAGHLFFG